MRIEDLPRGEYKAALEYAHFPTRLQAVVWRNWGLVPTERLAQALQAEPAQIEELARLMGLTEAPDGAEDWLIRGYITIIRRNWQLLPYGQILALLGWTAEELAFTLKEDDFLWHKLGQFKPAAEPVLYRRLNPEELRRTEELRAIVEGHFPPGRAAAERPFGFRQRYGKLANSAAAGKPSDFDLKLAYSYSALYGDPLLHQELDPYPDGLLADYAAAGVNAVWLQGTLYTLLPWAGESEHSAGWQTRLKNLRALAQRINRHGIKLILYMNEPRNMPDDFFAERPGWRGARSHEADDSYALCTSNPEVLGALEAGMAELFRQVPELGGVFTITMSENLTHCRSRGDLAESCPRCAQRPRAELPAEVNRAIARGVHRSCPEALVLAWAWGWTLEWGEDTVALLSDDVKLMSVSETYLPTNVGGVPGAVNDYSISKVGPGPLAERVWAAAARRGLDTVAKVQMNNTWECSAVPYIPTPQLVKEHLGKLTAAGVKNLMISWTLGGYPAGNVPLLNLSVEEYAAALLGQECAPGLIEAWEQFCAAFREFPLHGCNQLYFAPQNCGPSNLLWGRPSGYAATMVCFPYDDLESWRGGHYPEDVFEEQFRKLSEGWGQGLARLEALRPAVPQDKTESFADIGNVAEAVYCHFRSTYLQIKFVRARGRQPAEVLTAILDEEIALAQRLAAVVARDSRIGFEASNHYFYTYNDLREKVLNCANLKAMMGGNG